jgi:protein TonB
MRPIFVPVSKADIPARPNQEQSHTGPVAASHPLVVNQRRFTFQRVDRPSSDPTETTAPDLSGFAGRGTSDGVLKSIIGNYVRPVPTPTPPDHKPRISAIMEGNLISRVQPKYPVIARQTGLQGTVIVQAIIGRDGNIEKAVPVSGPPLLAPAALEAVTQWKYRPYYLNGEPIEVETQITVNFVLGR